MKNLIVAIVVIHLSSECCGAEYKPYEPPRSMPLPFPLGIPQGPIFIVQPTQCPPRREQPKPTTYDQVAKGYRGYQRGNVATYSNSYREPAPASKPVMYFNPYFEYTK